MSSLQPETLRLRRAVETEEDAAHDPRYPLIFDPQTAGGLLAGVPGARADTCIAALRAPGYAEARIVGEVVPRSAAAAAITARRSA